MTGNPRGRTARITGEEASAPMIEYPEGPLQPQVERDLMRRLASGEEEALRILYARFGRVIFGLGLRMLGTPESAEELTQDVFVAAWRKAARYDPSRGRLSTWLMVIAHNLCVDRLRRDSRRAVVAIDDLDDLLVGATSGEDAESTLLDRDAARRLLGCLSVPEQRLLLLAYYRGWTAREISEADRVPLGTVKTRMRTALIKIRRVHELKGRP